MDENFDEVCPFCGTNDSLVIEGESGAGYFMLCMNCTSTGPLAQDQGDAFTLWSTRLEANPEKLDYKLGAARLLLI